MLPSCVKLVFAALALGALPVRAAGEPAVMVGNRTIERVCWEASWQLGSFLTTHRKSTCVRIRYMPRTLTRTSKIGA
jgi:hypothetical protein